MCSFFPDIGRIISNEHELSESDWLKCRKVTTGVHDAVVRLKENHASLRVIDIGGQSAERNKWISHFEHVYGLLFVAAICEYDQSWEDEEGKSHNSLKTGLSLLKEFLSIPLFERKPVIVFLNKIDIFKMKLVYSSLRAHFPDYSGKYDFYQKHGIQWYI